MNTENRATIPGIERIHGRIDDLTFSINSIKSNITKHELYLSNLSNETKGIKDNVKEEFKEVKELIKEEFKEVKDLEKTMTNFDSKLTVTEKTFIRIEKDLENIKNDLEKTNNIIKEDFKEVKDLEKNVSSLMSELDKLKAVLNYTRWAFGAVAGLIATGAVLFELIVKK